jgi:ribosome assembly protein RRB1
MSKRTATELESSTRTGEPFQKSSGSGQKRENVKADEMGEFEDAWEDEIESDEEVVDADVQGEDGALESGSRDEYTNFIS